MPQSARAVSRLVALAGKQVFTRRVADLADRAAGSGLGARAAQQRHAAELIAGRILARGRAENLAEVRLAALAGELADAGARLPPAARPKLRERLHLALSGENTLLPLLHLAHASLSHRERAFSIDWSGLEHDTPHDLVLARDGSEAELVAEAVSAEAGRSVHRGAWVAFVDRLNPDLSAWLAAHPGRYLLKMTLPEGLSGPDRLPLLHARVMEMLQTSRRADSQPEVVLKLDPLVLAAAADQSQLVDRLRAEFGPEAHLAVTAPPPGPGGPGAAGRSSMFVMAARAGREDDVAAAIAARCHVMAGRLSGNRPGILSLLVDDIDRAEWRSLRDRLAIEGAARKFLTGAEARAVVCVQCLSRLELFGAAPPDAAPDGELRFRNPAHPAARSAALAPAVSSTL